MPTPDQARGGREAWHRGAEKVLDEDRIGPLIKTWEQTAQVPPRRATRSLLAHYEFDGNLGDSSGAYWYALGQGDITYGNGRVGRALIVDQLSRSTSMASRRSIATARSRYRFG